MGKHSDSKTPAEQKRKGAEPTMRTSNDAPMKTVTLPEGQRGPWFEGADIVTTLLVFGTSTEYALPISGKHFRLGSSPDCDIYVADPSVSKVHCVLERRGNAIRVVDQSSYNGTYFDGRRETTFDIRPGNTFNAAGVRFLALNEEMRAAFPTLTDILGADEELKQRPGLPSPSDFVLAAVNGAHVLITGQPGCEQERLAHVLHGISLRRGRELVELHDVPAGRAEQRAIIDRAHRSTLIYSIDEAAPVMDSTFASSLFSPTYQIRLVILAPTTSKAAAVWGAQNIATMAVLALRPLSFRLMAVPRLLDRLWIERGSKLRFYELTEANQAALQTYEWPENFVDLRLVADWLDVVATTPSNRKAAERLGVASTSFHNWLLRLGLSTRPLVRGAETDGSRRAT